MEIDIELIRPSPYQPRLVFDLNDLKEEIETDGLLVDLVVRKRGDLYELIDGERRWRTLKELGWKSVPVRVIEADDTIARLSVYKLNQIRKNYTVEEVAQYFKKLTVEGLTPLDISKQLNVDFHWVIAHLHVFKFPEDIQKAVWAKQISISHIIALESAISRNIKEAVLIIRQILERKLTVSGTKRIVQKRKREIKAKIDEARIKAAEEALPAIAPNVPKLKTPEDLEKTARALKEKAKMMRKGTLSLEDHSLQEKIKALQKEKEVLLKKKDVLTQALSFNCPHCNQPCLIYREGTDYWVE